MKGVVTYMVMDNLEVKPMSTISSITLLNKFDVKEIGALEEKVVELGMDEVCQLFFAFCVCMSLLLLCFVFFSFVRSGEKRF